MPSLAEYFLLAAVAPSSRAAFPISALSWGEYTHYVYLPFFAVSAGNFAPCVQDCSLPSSLAAAIARDGIKFERIVLGPGRVSLFLR